MRSRSGRAASRTSRTTLAKAAAQAKRAGASVYAIGIEGEDFSPAALKEMAAATGGAYFPASSSSAVADAYGAIAEQLRRTWRITYLSAARPGDTVDLKTTFAGFGSHETEVRMPGDASSALVKPGAGSRLIPGFVYDNNL